MPNHLTNETSPYLLQHANNPVDWYPWGEEAFRAAKAQQKPIFLSIGYSACHWCHVMAHESFEDPEIAGLLNEHFIAIKVDREERPELDQLYMEAVQILIGHGGWPLSAFLTPELRPFYGGTYWPPRARGNMPGFLQVLSAVAEAWKDRRAEIFLQAGKLTELLEESPGADSHAARGVLGPHLLDTAYAALTRAFDRQNGGFGHTPKFPHAAELRLLLRRWKRTGNDAILEMVQVSLDKMSSGGIYDHLGGGFHRYSTDAQWLVPHFEKMLYDQALLAGLYLEAYQVTGRGDYAGVVRETLDYVLRELTDPAGGFYCAEDADSEGEEGRYYLWTLEEVRQVLGAESARAFAHVYDVSETGNFEGKNILNRAKTVQQCAGLLAATSIRSGPSWPRHAASSTARVAAARPRARTTRYWSPGTRWRSTPWRALEACSANRAISTPRRAPPSSCWKRSAALRGDCCIRGGRDGRPSTPSSTTTPAWATH